jgi:hypothetical protein
MFEILRLDLAPGYKLLVPLLPLEQQATGPI